VELAQAAAHNYHELYIVSKKRDARYNEQEMFYELLVAWRGFPVGMATWNHTQIWLWIFRRWLVQKFMESLKTIQAWCARWDLFKSSHEEVSFVAKDETSVDIMCRRFSC
jgi:hypothetical protein